MIEELLRRFAQENFNNHYVPVLPGQSTIANPLSLMIKQKRPIWKIPFAKDELTILAGLEKYVSVVVKAGIGKPLAQRLLKSKGWRRGKMIQ